jgi:hypothetical protein
MIGKSMTNSSGLLLSLAIISALVAGNQIIGSVSATALPSAGTMLIAGFAGLGFFAHRRARKTTVVLAGA